MQVEAERAAQRPAPELAVDARGHQGNIGHVTLRNDGGRPNEQGAIDFRLSPARHIHTSSLPRGRK